MSNPTLLVRSAIASLLGASAALSQSTMTPLASFGTNGWLAPGSTPYLTTGNTERGLGYNPATGNLVLASRAGGNNLRVLHGTTGADLGALDATGVTGGTFPINMVDIAWDGSIYVCNLSGAANANFKVYRWNSEALNVPPTVAYDALTGMARTGDSFAVTGGLFTVPVQFAAAGSANANNSCFAVGPVDGSNASTTYLSIPGTPNGVSNGYRLGLTFVDQDTLIGTQGTTGLLTSFSGPTATLLASIPLAAAQRAMDYTEIAGTPVLAVMDSNSSVVSIFDISAPAAPTLLVAGTTTVAPLAPNTNGTGAVQWGQVSGNTATLYAMNSNQGIQAFQVTIALPASVRSFGLGCGSPALTLSASGAPVLPSTISLDLNNVPANAVVFYVLAFVGIPGGIQLPIAPGCNQYLVPFTSTLVIPTTPGIAQLSQSFPGDPRYAGTEIFVQGASLDGLTNSIRTSNGLRLYVQTF